ncbi:hypothetical protein [Marinomonas aquiplantarum]|uniref:Uncharacterized protein n=1 Tax=Marinomonas aquiplantarum TaxID=491951 RepID=A0A366D1C4_9GAMM|nr:hypothetical protein [Marinomonas aquiplantarum]RBO83299.1 hypothetical protein DFP76_104114 [Marinomonas aquiplantarum]
MKIRITSFETVDGNVVVNFNSSVGNGVATWVGAKEPVKNYEYDVEIDIEKSIDQVKSSKNNNEGRYSMSIGDDSTIMNGEVEFVEEDGMAYIRLSQDCLIMIDSGDSKVKDGDWINLNIPCEDIKVSAQGN